MRLSLRLCLYCIFHMLFPSYVPRTTNIVADKFAKTGTLSRCSFSMINRENLHIQVLSLYKSYKSLISFIPKTRFSWHIMDNLTSDSQLNQSKVDFETESNEVPETFCAVDDQFVPKVGMTFKTLDDTAKFYKDYSKIAGFSTRVRCTNKKENEIKNQLITCTREGKWK
ncbi:hypothetical protein Ahy_B06g084304 [Arachis hypogaea]|uniref:FAR1 domain-containing protein n=1 Tax=Arachis hypogaea TaxID=3818 RepID=A0A444YRJ6_ARAHY|nr:hypothetical protein Ahy_B06g084304 [Arachis hypogaea]